jgi:hypothetical protein
MSRISLSCAALILSISGMAAETPSITGVWKADLDASNFGRMKPSAYVMIIQQQGNTIRETIGDTGMMGAYRSSFTFSTSAPDNRNSWRGTPMHSKAQWTEGSLSVDSRLAGPRGMTMHDKYSLSADGNTLTIERTTTREGKDITQTIVLTRQPDEAGEPLRQPEAAASQQFKNVKLLGEMPASKFLDTMSVFTVALGEHCEFCHVERDFASDDKKEKTIARHMIEMTHTANEQTFEGRSEVQCYTCHRGDKKPLSTPE